MTRFIAWLLTEPLFWAGWGIVLGPILFLRGFRLLQRKQLILDTPRSTIRGAALGLVEMSGKAVGPYTLVSPLSETDCLYYRLTGKSEPGSELVSPKMRELCAPLFLDDGTGTLMIYPERCELDLQPSFSSENDDAAEEYCIRPGDKIFVRGTLRENPWATKSPVTERGEFSRIGPGYVSAAEADILRRKYYPALDPNFPSGSEIASVADFDLHPPVILMKGDGPFVISTRGEREIASRLNWKSMVYIWGGPAATLWGLWQILRAAKAARLLPGDL